MSTFRVPLEVGALDGSGFITVQALVDTGSSHSSIPGVALRSLGIESVDRFSFTLADNRVIELGVGPAQVRVAGRQGVTMVVFGDDAASPLLGAVTLEELNLGVDPLKKRLIPVTGLLMQVN